MSFQYLSQDLHGYSLDSFREDDPMNDVQGLFLSSVLSWYAFSEERDGVQFEVNAEIAGYPREGSLLIAEARK